MNCPRRMAQSMYQKLGGVNTSASDRGMTSDISVITGT